MKNLLLSLNIGQTLYSPICGSCSVVALDIDELYCITVRAPYGTDFNFDKYGRYAVGGEPLLFQEKMTFAQ